MFKLLLVGIWFSTSSLFLLVVGVRVCESLVWFGVRRRYHIDFERALL